MNQEREAVALTLYGFAPLSRLAALDGGGEERQEIPWDELTVSLKHEERAHADLMRRRADQILALRSGGEGWRLVPVEPTEAMVKAAEGALSEWRKTLDRDEAMMRSYQAHDRKFIASATPAEKHRIRYRAMLSAAPSPSTHGEG